MTDENPQDDALPSSAEIAARRAAQIVARLRDEPEGGQDEASEQSETHLVGGSNKPPATDDPFAAYRDLPPPSEEELLELRRGAAEAARYLEALKRAKADFINYQNRMDRERKLTREFARRDVVAEMLDVIDKFQLSMAKAADYGEFQSFLDAMKLVESEIEASMERLGLERIATTNATFDPECHEAILQMEDAHVPPGVILKEARAGYRLGESVLRPSQVVVSKAPLASPAPPEDPPAEPGAD